MEEGLPPSKANSSIFHLILWIFAIGSEVTPSQRQRIQNLYGSSQQSLNPLVSSEQEFMELMEKIKKTNKKFIVKVVTDQEMEKCIIKAYLKGKDTIKDIYLYYQQLAGSYLFPKSLPVPKNNKQLVQLRQSNQSVIYRNQKIYSYIFFELDDCIKKAQRQIQKIYKSYRTFQNSHLLVENFQKINRYRFRLISFINLKVSDFKKSFQMFYQYAKKELPNLNLHFKGMGRNEMTMADLNRRLLSYQKLANQFIEKEFQREQRRAKKTLQFEISQNLNTQQQSIENPQEQKYKFYHNIISIYQDESIFYHLLNTNLKLIGDQDYNWRELTLPFTHVYNSIKFLYRSEVSKNNKFYLKPFVVYRVGRARKSEIERYEHYQGKAFVEFYGFFSTSLSAKIAIDNFMSQDSLHNQLSQKSIEDQGEEWVIFRIEVNPNQKILDEKYNYLVNGFFKLGQFQRNGDNQKQVLFNALNVFRLRKKSKCSINKLFSSQQIQEILLSYQMPVQTSNKSSLYKIKDQKQKSYQKQITVIDLQFGSFYEQLLDKTKMKEEDKPARENYIYCMNKVRQFQQFDEGDVYQLTNDLEECYRYLITKVLRKKDSSQQQENKMEQLIISVIDNKNYFQRLSTVCNKLGKVREAETYNNIAIQCHEKLKSISQNNLYNQYSEKLLNMRYKSIQIYQQYGDYVKQGEKLKDQLNIARENAKSLMPLAQIEVSKIYIGQAINYYRRGKLQESRNRFIKCSHKLSKIISQYSFDVEQQCYIGAYLKNFFLCQGPCCYSQFKQHLKTEEKKKRTQQLINKYGSKQLLQSICKLANDLLMLVNNSTDQRNGVFKSRKKYQEFILQYGQKYNIFPARIQNQSTQQAIINSIRETILKLSGLQRSSKEYVSQYENLQQKIKQLDIYSLNHLELAKDQPFIRKFIKTFKQKQIQKRLREIREKMASNLQKNLIQDYKKCADQIQQGIEQLKREGYVERTLEILKKRNQKALIYYECERRELALAEINEIIKNGTIKQQNRDFQLANAYLTKGKIQLQGKDSQKAYESLSQSIEYFKQDNKESPNEIEIEVQEVMSVSQISHKSTKNNKIINIHKEHKIYQKYESLQARILRIRALLVWIQKKIKEEDGKTETIKKKVKDFWQNHSNFYMRIVLKQIEHLSKIIKQGSEIQLQCSLQQIRFQYYMNLPQHQMSMKDIFKPLERCIQIYKLNNLENIHLIYADNILRFHQKPYSLEYFIKYKSKEQLIKAQAQGTEQPNYWKILKAKYWIHKHLSSNSGEIQRCLLDAIKELKQKVQSTHAEYLYEEIQELEKENPLIIQFQETIQNISIIEQLYE